MPLPSAYVSTDSVVINGTPRNLSRLYHQTWTDPAAADDNGHVTTVAGPNATTATYSRAAGTLTGVLAGIHDFPRNVVITVTHATAVVALSGVITGKDIYGRVMTEAWAVTAGTTSKVFTGTKAFAIVDSITVIAATDASADSVIIGSGAVFGLDLNCSIAKGVITLEDGSVVTTGTVVAKSTSATADPRGTFAPNTAPNGTHDYELAYVTDHPEAS
jgi:hypothetical protein